MAHTLLLADDSVTIRRVIELTFADEQVRVVSVSSGREAIASIEAAPPDIILADAGMPDVSGYDIAAFVKGRPDLRHIPVILLAGAFEPLDEARSRQSGSDGVLVKPFEPQMVVSRVRELLPGQAAAVPPAARAAAPAGTAAPAPAGQPYQAPSLEPAPSAAAAGPIDPLFDPSLDRLDEAFASGAGTEGPAIDSSTASDFANDLRDLRSGQSDSGGFERQDFGEWDLPVRAPAGTDGTEPPADAAAGVFSAPEPEPVVSPLPPSIMLAPKGDAPPASAPRTPSIRPARPGVPLADKFSSLLAAEEGRPHPLHTAAPGGPGSVELTDDEMEQIVDRLIERLGPGVRAAVIDLAERLVRAEIDRLKALR